MVRRKANVCEQLPLLVAVQRPRVHEKENDVYGKIRAILIGKTF